MPINCTPWKALTRLLKFPCHPAEGRVIKNYVYLDSNLLSFINLMHFFNATHKVKVKVKIKLSLCFFISAPRHEGVLGEWMYSSTHALTSALGEGEWPASHAG